MMRSGDYATREIRKAPVSKKKAVRKGSAESVAIKKADRKHKPSGRD